MFFVVEWHHDEGNKTKNLSKNMSELNVQRSYNISNLTMLFFCEISILSEAFSPLPPPLFLTPSSFLLSRCYFLPFTHVSQFCLQANDFFLTLSFFLFRSFLSLFFLLLSKSLATLNYPEPTNHREGKIVGERERAALKGRDRE